MSIRVFVSVGTDHHPFGRLIEWVDLWAEGRDDLELIVQHGSTSPSRIGSNHALLGADRLAEEYAAADIVVSQVGPGTIADANAAGHRPIVVPRDPALGEVVDGHQFAFGDFMAARERCWVVRTREELDDLLAMLVDGPAVRRHPASSSGEEAAAAVDRLVRRVVGSPGRRFSARRAWSMLRAPRDAAISESYSSTAAADGVPAA